MTDSGDILSLLGIPRDKVAFIDGFHIDENEDKIIISLIYDVKIARNRLNNLFHFTNPVKAFLKSQRSLY